MKFFFACCILIFCGGCASPWKVQGGPQACRNMCQEWGLEFTAMVGVGNQDSSGAGATACVCQPRQNKISSMGGSGAASASLAAPITAEAAAQAAHAAAATQSMLLQSQPPRY